MTRREGADDQHNRFGSKRIVVMLRPIFGCVSDVPQLAVQVFFAASFGRILALFRRRVRSYRQPAPLANQSS